MKKAFIISGVFISSLVGAGFASGSEILYYFSRYKFHGLLGLLFSCILFGVLQYLIILHTSKIKDSTIDKYLSLIMNKNLSRLISVFTYIFTLIVFCAMLSGFSGMCFEIFGLRKIYGVTIMLVFTYIIILSGYSGFLKWESTLCTFIVASILFVMGYILICFENNVSVFSITNNAFTSSLSYVGYNILSLCAVLCVLGENPYKKTIVFSSLITTVTLIVIMVPMWYIICVYSGMIDLGEIPLLAICQRYGKSLYFLCSLAIFISMLTTAVSSCFVLDKKLCLHLPKQISHLGLICVSFLLSSLDFSFIVDKLYRVGGYISCYVIFSILKYHFLQRNFNIVRYLKKNKEK